MPKKRRDKQQTKRIAKQPAAVTERGNGSKGAGGSGDSTGGEQPTSVAIRVLHEQAERDVPDELADTDAAMAQEPTPEGMDLRTLWKTAESARRAWEQACRALQTERDQVENERQALKTQHDENEARTGELREWEQRLEAREEEIRKGQDELAHARAEWSAELAQRKRTALSALYAEDEKLSAGIVKLEDELRERRLKLEREIVEARERADEELAAERLQLREQERQLRRQQNELEAARQDLRLERGDMDARVKRLVDREVADREAEWDGLERRLQQAAEDRERLRRELAAREEAMGRLEGQRPEDVVRELDGLREALRARERELATRPREEHLDELRARIESLETERVELLEQRRELQLEKARLQRQREGVWELETLRAERDKLETYNGSLKRAYDELRADIERLTDDRRERPVFASLLRIDASREYQSGPGVRTGDIGDLRRLARYARHRMAQFPQDADPSTRKRLYYRNRDVRAFLGGMAASRLHVLQGPSGTGKTSLPRAFAWAIGAGVRVISVQAGWRERADLLGYYNAFEKRFHETEFLQALYEAGTPRYESLPYLLVLDEMNLSRPEQYFADFLSLLERADDHDPLELVSAAVEPAPRGLVDGRGLRLPRNAWFVGTANKDETTLELAPKTYDRAHVQELPRKHRTFDIRNVDAIEPILREVLDKAFDDAAEQRETEAHAVLAFLNGRVGELLANRFDVQWGNRLEQHALRFVPVVLEAGGNMAEAADHLLTTRLLRQIVDRPGIQTSDLDDLRSTVEEEMRTLGEPPSQWDWLPPIEHERLRAEGTIG